MMMMMMMMMMSLYPNTMAFSSITAPRGWPDLIAPRIPPGLCLGRPKAQRLKGPSAQRLKGSGAQGLRGSRARGPKGPETRPKGAPDRAQDRPKVAPGGALGPVRPSGLPALGPQGSFGALSGARSTTRILRFGGGSGLPRQASLGRDPRLESCDLGRAQIELSSIGLRCSRHKMRNPPRPNTTFSNLAGALQ